MGIYHCDNCNEVMDGESFWCDFGQEECGTFCDSCACHGNCDECNTSLCVSCAKATTYECCGKLLCGAAYEDLRYRDQSTENSDDECLEVDKDGNPVVGKRKREEESTTEETCFGKHHVWKLDCGHLTCNLVSATGETASCRTCKSEASRKTEEDAIKKDIEIIKSFVDQLSSKSLSKGLHDLLSDPEQTTQKRLQESLESTELKLARARNEADGCRCGRGRHY